MPRPKKNKQAGAAFKVLLKEKGFSNYKLAKAIGMGAGHIGRIASGEIASPTPATLEKIAAELGVELGELTMMFAQSSVRSHSAEVPPPEGEAQEETVSKNTDFVGREEAIAHLDSLVNEGAKVILIQGEGGIGKTTLAEKWFERQGLKNLNLLELDVGKTRQTIFPVEDWLKQKLRSNFDENPEQNFRAMLEQLKGKLQIQRTGLLIDNLEPALFNGEFIKPNKNYIELLRVLAHSTVQSVTFITSRELLHEPGVMSLQTVKNYPQLEGLDLDAWGKYFNNHKISVDVETLSEMRQAYGGNAEVMCILRGDVQKQCQGNLKAYWLENRDDLLRHPTLEKLVQRQFNKLRDDNSQAYELLCRFGFYPNSNFPPVPKVWLFCLLWDVPEKRRQRVIDALCDRSLVKVNNNGYYLHQVIRIEASERLKLSKKSNCEKLFLIKQQIDARLTSDDKLQQLLAWVNQKSLSVQLPYKPATVRAVYITRPPDLDLARNRDLAYAIGLDLAYGYYLARTDNIEFALERVLELALKTERNTGFALNNALYGASDCTPKLKQVLQQLKEQLPNPEENSEIFDWWQSNGQAWTEQLRAVMIKHCNIGHDWQFSNQQKDLLKQYYDANKLLVDCMNNASDTVRSHIEDTLLLPFAEIKEIEQQRSIK